ncbi:MAG: hypothetical protein QF619_09430 [Candidatus Binatia bacterium]|jgi:hypothetical protein|nr:hypothetical protein [Candidatus Binatia bacterium]
MQTGVLVTTGLIIIWFAWETRQLGKESRRQTENQLRPFILFMPAPQSHTGMAFEVSNVGNGTATNVKIGYMSISASDELTIRFSDTLPAVRQGESLLVTGHVHRMGKSPNPSDIHLENLNPNYTGRTYQLDVSFQDVESRPYSVEEIISPRTLSIVGEPTK